jgi:hypothetical protein
MTKDKNENEYYISVLRGKTGEERLRLGMELYDIAFKTVQDGIRHQHPKWNASQVRAETLRRFAIASGRVL